MTRAEHRARGLELLGKAENALLALDYEAAGALAAMATAHLEAARRYRAPGNGEGGDVIRIPLGRRRELRIGRFPSDCGPCDGTGTEPWWRLPAWCAVVGFVGGTAAALAASYFTGAAAVAVWAAVLAAAGVSGGFAYRGKP